MSQKQAIYWRCRRGVLELDAILQPFFLEVYDQMSDQEQKTFVALLDEQDPELQMWLIYEQNIPKPWQAMVQRIRDFIQDRKLS